LVKFLLEKEGKKEIPIFFLPKRGTLQAEKRNKKRAYLPNILVVPSSSLT